MRIGRLFGIGVYVHWTFLILVVWVVGASLSRGNTPAQAARSLLFVLVIFGCVVLHEFGHALAARRFGIGTRDITILPIGGVARLERIPTNPFHEFVISIAGPAVNVAIAAILGAALYLQNRLGSMPALDLIQGRFFEQVLVVNIFLVLFNMIPAFPMDGGRVLRAILAASMDRARATVIAGRIGQVIAVGFAIVGLRTDIFLVFIALFIFMGAQAEIRWARLSRDARPHDPRSAP